MRDEDDGLPRCAGGDCVEIPGEAPGTSPPAGQQVRAMALGQDLLCVFRELRSR